MNFTRRWFLKAVPAVAAGVALAPVAPRVLRQDDLKQALTWLETVPAVEPHVTTFKRFTIGIVLPQEAIEAMARVRHPQLTYRGFATKSLGKFRTS